MTDLPMSQIDHPVHNVPAPTEDYQGDELGMDIASELHLQRAVKTKKAKGFQ